MGFASPFPQTAYSGLKFFFQQEWQFVLRVTPGVVPLFAPLGEASRDAFLPDLLGGRREEVNDSL